MEYKERTIAPNNELYWVHTSNGGYNSCIKINGTKYCIPNCVGYAWGRWYELLGEKPKLSRANAEDWFGYNDGYQRGNTPKLGAVMCWRKGNVKNVNDGAGHVAIVEKINDDGSVIASQSNYGGNRWELVTYKKGYALKGQVFQGFIYTPIEFEGKQIENNVYVVKKGDTLSKIASMFGTTYKKLAEYNGIANPNIINIGQKIKIPLKENKKTTNYIVKKGDSLSKIGKMYNVNWKDIAKDNNIKAPFYIIRVGQVLKINKI